MKKFDDRKSGGKVIQDESIVELAKKNGEATEEAIAVEKVKEACGKNDAWDVANEVVSPVADFAEVED